MSSEGVYSNSDSEGDAAEPRPRSAVPNDLERPSKGEARSAFLSTRTEFTWKTPISTKEKMKTECAVEGCEVLVLSLFFLLSLFSLFIHLDSLALMLAVLTLLVSFFLFLPSLLSLAMLSPLLFRLTSGFDARRLLLEKFGIPPRAS